MGIEPFWRVFKNKGPAPVVGSTLQILRQRPFVERPAVFYHLPEGLLPFGWPRLGRALRRWPKRRAHA
ncbi:hypothetical protein CHR62_07330 [Pusillimonas sp. NJUB218]|nr:hypothetical protein CHR62_07330 [Pusillimonas sp. NJUB218]